MQYLTSRAVCEFIFGDVIQGGVFLFTCPVLGTPKLHRFDCLEFRIDNAMQCNCFHQNGFRIDNEIILCPMVRFMQCNLYFCRISNSL